MWRSPPTRQLAVHRFDFVAPRSEFGKDRGPNTPPEVTGIRGKAPYGVATPDEEAAMRGDRELHSTDVGRTGIAQHCDQTGVRQAHGSHRAARTTHGELAGAARSARAR